MAIQCRAEQQESKIAEEEKSTGEVKRLQEEEERLAKYRQEAAEKTAKQAEEARLEQEGLARLAKQLQEEEDRKQARLRPQAQQTTRRGSSDWPGVEDRRSSQQAPDSELQAQAQPESQERSAWEGWKESSEPAPSILQSRPMSRHDYNIPSGGPSGQATARHRRLSALASEFVPSSFGSSPGSNALMSEGPKASLHLKSLPYPSHSS